MQGAVNEQSSMDWARTPPVHRSQQSYDKHESSGPGLALGHAASTAPPAMGAHTAGPCPDDPRESPRAKRQKFMAMSDLVDMDPGPAPSPAPKAMLSNTPPTSLGTLSNRAPEPGGSHDTPAGVPGIQRPALGEGDIEDLMELAHQAALQGEQHFCARSNLSVQTVCLGR